MLCHIVSYTNLKDLVNLSVASNNPVTGNLDDENRNPPQHTYTVVTFEPFRNNFFASDV